MKDHSSTTKSEDCQYIGQLESYAWRCLSLLKQNRHSASAANQSAMVIGLDSEISALEEFLGYDS